MLVMLRSVFTLRSMTEYYAVSEVAMEIMFIKNLLEFLGIEIDFPITVNCDNVGAIFLSQNAKNNNRTKHIDIRAHYVRQFIEDGILKIVFVKSADNEADVFTKNVSNKIFERHATKNLVDVGQNRKDVERSVSGPSRS